jgi:uncharacterized membrane protein
MRDLIGQAQARYSLRPALLAVVSLLSLGGIAVSSYLAYGNIGDESLFCELGHGCDAVQASQYSVVIGVPIAVWGLLLYLVMLLAAAAGLSRSKSGELPSLGLFGASLAGTVYSGYLAWLELYRIDAVCMWCTISALIVTAILVTSALNLALERQAASTGERGVDRSKMKARDPIEEVGQ